MSPSGCSASKQAPANIPKAVHHLRKAANALHGDALRPVLESTIAALLAYDTDRSTERCSPTSPPPLTRHCMLAAQPGRCARRLRRCRERYQRIHGGNKTSGPPSTQRRIVVMKSTGCSAVEYDRHVLAGEHWWLDCRHLKEAYEQ